MLRLFGLPLFVLFPAFVAAQGLSPASGSSAVLPKDSAQSVASPPPVKVAVPRDSAKAFVPAIVPDTGRAPLAKADSTSASAPVLSAVPAVAPVATIPVISRLASKRTSTAAILPFTGDLPASELSAITGRFESEMIARDSFWILERRRMDQLLKEQGFQQSGSCSGSDCQVEVGQLLGVQKLFLGEISQVGGLLTLTLRRVDVGSGRSEFSHALDIRGTTEDMLRLGCREMSLIASGVKSPDGDRSVLVPEKKTRLWPWLLGGAVVVGGGVTAAVLLTQSKSSNSTAAPLPSETSVWVGW